ncbi:PTS galactosamine/N-acetylgalactosamine transporter subunit IIA [Vibrio sp. T20]|uniref:PTS galactosamine/N-acetylgalactosamine transporter subunit IIA n=1 Tax=Vibrio sp. T20 TaxID=2588450 RepID=UPI0011B4B678|nr:PTS galactosamine/N-acetylgalactosamine transporter subunit IIA [Vibrio sp. T20]
MIGILVSGHINFASGMKSAVEAIVGEQDNVEFIDFVPTISTEELEEAMISSINRIDKGQGVLILTDVPGGTPCNRAVSIMMNRENVKVIAGTNLPMITNACFERDDTTVSELAETIIEIGSQTIVNPEEQLKAADTQADTFEDAL